MGDRRHDTRIKRTNETAYLELTSSSPLHLIHCETGMETQIIIYDFSKLIEALR